jgi:hypothetical protein
MNFSGGKAIFTLLTSLPLRKSTIVCWHRSSVSMLSWPALGITM